MRLDRENVAAHWYVRAEVWSPVWWLSALTVEDDRQVSYDTSHISCSMSANQEGRTTAAGSGAAACGVGSFLLPGLGRGRGEIRRWQRANVRPVGRPSSGIVGTMTRPFSQVDVF